MFAVLCKAIKLEEKGKRPDIETPKPSSQDKDADDLTIKTDTLPPKLPGINIQKALNALQIDGGVFKRILIGFLNNNKDTANNIKDLFEKKDWGSLMHVAHSLKGSAGNIGAEELYATALDLETASRKGEKKPPGYELIDKVESDLNQVLQSLQSFVETPKADELDEKEIHLKPEQFLLMLNHLADALDSADPEEINMHFNAVKKHLDRSTFKRLENQINNYDYDKALKTINRKLKIED